MNVRDLSYVVAIADHGSLTRAAEAVDVTQPTLSAQIAKLERELGVALFERDGRVLRLTDAGHTVLEHARRVLGAVDDLVAAAQDHLDPFAGTLKLGIIPTLAPYLLPHLLPAMRETLPRLNPAIVEEQTAQLLEHLRVGTLDAAMLATQTDDERFATISLFDEPLWVAVPPSHPFADRTSVEPGDIDPSTLLLLAEGHCLRDQALAFCAEPSLGAGISGDFRAASLETIVHLVEAGLGITLVPELYLRKLHPSRAAVVLRPLASPTASRRIQLAFRRSTPRGGVLREVGRITRNLWSQISN